MADLGVITIGQAPRTDLTPELARWLPGVRLYERGALDGLSRDEIAMMAPREGEEVLTTRLADGSSVIIGHDHVLPRMQAAVTDLESAGVDAVLLACTGTFPAFAHSRPLLTPELMIGPGVAALAGRAQTVGILVPLPEQRHHPDGKYAALDAELVVADATPYSARDDDLLAAADELRAQGAELIVADCMGYSQRMRRLIAARAGVPVVLARSIVARLTAELLDDGATA